MISPWMSCVPSYVFTASRFNMCRMMWYSSDIPLPPNISLAFLAIFKDFKQLFLLIIDIVSGISIFSSLLRANWNWTHSSSNVDNLLIWIGTSNSHKHVHMILGKVSCKGFGWLVICSVFVDALSVKSMLFSYDLLCKVFMRNTQKCEVNARAYPHES